VAVILQHSRPDVTDNYIIHFVRQMIMFYSKGLHLTSVAIKRFFCDHYIKLVTMYTICLNIIKFLIFFVDTIYLFGIDRTSLITATVSLSLLFVPCNLTESFIHNTNESTFHTKKIQSFNVSTCFGIINAIFRELYNKPFINYWNITNYSI
jgi:hypothetical protein